MRNDNSGLDERQREIYNKIGSQTFELMAFALLVDIVLYVLGIRWLDYPDKIMAIVLACSCVYLVRLIIAGAYQHPIIKKRKRTILIFIIGVVGAIASSAVVRRLPVDITESTSSYAAYILMGVSLAGLLAIGVASLVKKKRDKENNDD